MHDLHLVRREYQYVATAPAGGQQNDEFVLWGSGQHEACCVRTCFRACPDVHFSGRDLERGLR